MTIFISEKFIQTKNGGIMKKALVIVGVILITVLIAAGSFWGGMAYQTRQVEQARSNFFAARGFGDQGQIPEDGQFFPEMESQTGGGFPQAGGQNFGFPGGRGTTGQVKSIAGSVMTLSTAQNVTTVNLSDSTQIQKTVSGTTQDLQPGTRVMVTGEKANDGGIAADRITILDSNAPVFNGPPPGDVQP
jgi:hypothetical protein